MTLRLLKSTMPGLRQAMPMLQHRAPEQIVERVDGNTMRALKKRALARSGWLCECPECKAGYPVKLTWGTTQLDHAIPLYLGGTNAIENLRALHYDCHARITAQQATERARGIRPWGHKLEPGRVAPPRPPRTPNDDDMPC